VAIPSFVRLCYIGLRQNNLSDVSESVLGAFYHFDRWLGEFMVLGCIPVGPVMTCPFSTLTGYAKLSDILGLLEYSWDCNLSCFLCTWV